MPVTLAQLKAVSKPLVVTYEGVPINLRYSPGKYTPDFETSLNADEASRAQFLPQLLTELITDWDIYSDDQGTVKADITPSTLSGPGFGYSLLNKIATEIIKDLSPGEATAVNSGSF